MSLRLGASLNSESRRRVSYIPTRASSWDQGKEQDKRPEPTGGITESDIPEPSGRYPLPPTNPNTRITLGTDHEVTIRVGDDSLKLRNVDEKLQMRVEGIWIPVSDLVSKWLHP